MATQTTPRYEEQVISLLTQVRVEDNTICEAMHRGMRSSELVTARLLPENEALVVSFHQLLHQRRHDRR